MFWVIIYQYTVGNGTTQGSVISPPLFSIIIGTSRYMKVVQCLLMMGPSGKEERTWIMTSGKCKEQLMKWWSVFTRKRIEEGMS